MYYNGRLRHLLIESPIIWYGHMIQRNSNEVTHKKKYPNDKSIVFLYL